MTTLARSPAPTLVDPALQHEIEQFLYAEADLLDDWDTDEWYTLMAEDIHYWAPTRQARTSRERHLELARPLTAAYFDEDHALLGQRVARMNTGVAWAEDPLSRLRHLISNVRVRPTDDPAEYEVGSSFHVFRTSVERETDSFVGRRHDVLRRADNAYGFQIARRTILLDVNILPSKNISFFF